MYLLMTKKTIYHRKLLSKSFYKLKLNLKIQKHYEF